MDKDFLNRIEELSRRAENRGIYTYTDFLNATEIARVKDIKLSAKIEAFGGADFCERRIIRFGDFGYEEEYPIKILHVRPTGEKFCKELGNRDFLGAVLGLGIERSKIGDIFVSGKSAYVVVLDTVVAFIAENLTKVGSASVRCYSVDSLPKDLAPKRQEIKISVSSARLDAVICRLYNLSRENGGEIFKAGRVFVNGKEQGSPAYQPKNGDVMSVRGFGKFIFCGECGKSAKGKTYVKIEKYV